MIPARTSPDPAVARYGASLTFITTFPSGSAITVSAPLSKTILPANLAASTHLSTLSSINAIPSPNSLLNSPS